MSRKAENVFISGVHDYLPPVAELYRFKSHNPFIGGIPDWYYSGNKADMWIEYKFVVLPKRDSTLIVPDLSELQRQWLNNRWDEGRNVYVIVGSKNGGLVFEDKQWNSGVTTSEFKGWMQSRSALADWIKDQVTQEQTCR